MTLDQLRIFLHVAEREHITRAAAALNLSQSAVSAAIAALEARHAVQLFDRVGRRVVLTNAGRAFVAEARAVLARAQQAEQVLADLAGLRRGVLRLAASQTVAGYWLPPFMAAFRDAYPGFELQLTIGNSTDIVRLVRESAVDLGFVEGEVEDALIRVEAVSGDEMVLAVAPQHRWASRPPSGSEDLRRGPWVIREEGSGTRAILAAALARQGLALGAVDIALVLPSNEAVRAAVEAGSGATILSALVLRDSLAMGLTVSVPIDLAPRPFRILQHRERRPSLAEQRFLGMVAEGQAGTGAMTALS